jgi:hypothetical protein
MAAPDIPPSPTLSALPPVPGSPTYSYASTVNPLSQYNLPLPPPPRPAHAVLSAADLEASQSAYTDLLSSAKAYRTALAALSGAASAFGSALEACARLKESRAEALGPPVAASLSHSFNAKGSCTADTLLATSGVHHLVANHTQILSETLYRSFEVPLLHDVDRWSRVVADENEGYAAAAREKGKEIRRLEKEGLKLHRQQKRRDVARMRSHLVDLTTRLDGLTSLHADHARALLRESQECSVHVADAACSLVRAEVDIFESLARKGWTGGGLDEVLERGEDLFAAAASEDHNAATDPGTTLFSILPPKSILADSASEITRPGGHGRADSLLMPEPERYQSLAGAVGRGDDADSVFSEPVGRPRGGGPRPFSPPPMAVDPGEALGGDDHEATPRPSGFKMLRRSFDEEEGEDGHPWRDEGARTPAASDRGDADSSGRWDGEGRE